MNAVRALQFAVTGAGRTTSHACGWASQHAQVPRTVACAPMRRRFVTRFRF
jgi:hypothetical protein